MNNLTLRLTPADAEHVTTIAAAMRTPYAPFVTRSAVVKLALAAVAANPTRFIEAAKAVPTAVGSRP